MNSVPLPSCSDCPAFLRCEKTDLEKNGVRLEPGSCYCISGKRPRRFSSKAVRIRVPDWCPRRKKPCEIRVYDFKSANDRLMHSFLQCEFKHDINPEERRYAIAYEGHTELTPRNFWLACNKAPIKELIGQTVRWYCIVEIDDGLRPYCFYRTEKRFILLPYFRTETARKNIMEDGVPMT